MIISRLTLAAAVAATTLSIAPLSAQDPLRGLDDYIESAREDWNVAGLAVGVVRNDSLVYAKGFGVRDVRTGEPVNDETLFAIGSNSKAWTALALGLLVDEGKVSWDDKVTEHLPWFQLYDTYATREMTVRDLLTHRSGLSRGDQIWYASPYDREEIVRRVRYLEPSWSFRSQYGYQNIMFITAGLIIEELSGVSWDRFIEDRFFGPLGMHASVTTNDSLAVRSNKAQPHSAADGAPVAIDWRNIDNAGPAGSILSNVTEMGSWLRMQLNHGVFNGRRIASDSVIEEQRTPQMISGARGDTLQPTHFNLYGLGIALKDYHGYKVVNHGGGIDGMLSQTAFVPELNLGIVVLTNTEPNNLNSALINYIMDAHMPGVERKDWSRLYLDRFREGQARQDSVRQATIAARATGTSPSHPLAAYAGTYENRMYGPLRIAQEGGKLVFRRHDAYRGEMTHWHYDTFQVDFDHPRQGEILVTFQLDAKGDIVAVEVPGLGEYEKVREGSGVAGRN